VIDPASGDIVATIAIEGKLEGLAFDGRGQGFVNVEDKSSVAVFDTHKFTSKALWTSAPGEGGTGLACDAAHHRIFSACANNMVVVLDSDSGKIVATPASGEDPDGLVFEAKTGRIFTPNPDGTPVDHPTGLARQILAPATVKTAMGCKTIALDEKTGTD